GQSEGGWEGQTRYIVSAAAASPSPTRTTINSFARMLLSSLSVHDYRGCERVGSGADGIYRCVAFHAEEFDPGRAARSFAALGHCPCFIRRHIDRRSGVGRHRDFQLEFAALKLPVARHPAL